MKHILAVALSGFFLLAACQPVSPQENLPTETPYLVVQIIPTATAVPVFIPTPVAACDPTSVDFCLVDWKATFQNPLGLDSPLTIARSYSYGSTENGERDPHHGVDLESKEGNPVYAPAEGVVIFAGRDHERIYTPWDDYYGNLIVIQHANGLFSLYGHLSKISVSVGDQVNPGNVIAAVGHTGVAIGSHLHFEVRTGGDGTDFFSTENPELWLPLDDGMGAISITLGMGNEAKSERKLVFYRYAPGTNTSEKKYYLATYPKGFEHNAEDFALSDLPPARYRIAFSDSGGLYERVVVVEAGKLTQVVFQLK
jgi:murein DD-endopeptidase MepM/ murein hydrolase activator NlpD